MNFHVRDKDNQAVRCGRKIETFSSFFGDAFVRPETAAAEEPDLFYWKDGDNVCAACASCVARRKGD